MKIAVYSTKPYDRQSLTHVNAAFGHELVFHKAALELSTVPLASGCQAICAFVNDHLDAPILRKLGEQGVRTIAMRCAGFNNVDLVAAKDLGIRICRVPAYSPHAVAEFALTMLLSLNRKIHRAYSRVRENNFALDGLLGFDICGKTVGVIGTGRIGQIFAKIMRGMDCRVLGYDLYPNADMAKQIGFEYVGLPELLAQSDMVSLHCPLSPQTHHIINPQTLAQMKHGAMLINTSRGGLIDTAAAIEALKSGQLGALGIDVYEEEGDLFFEDLSNQVITDDVFSRLLTLPNVMVTGHQAFFTAEAMENIARTTLGNLSEVEKTGNCANWVS